ncbi:tail fiber domain-containing protein [Agrobacterium radiobacter]|uniref:tail fiber domain-containing protein n=1 Tax=Agrobacterium radiobacter TaxID=362 RepID=UPI00342D53C9
MTFLVNDGSQVASVRGVVANPEPGTYDKAFHVNQTGPSEGTQPGPFFHNLVDVIWRSSLSGYGLPGLSGSQTYAAWQVSLNAGGENFNGTQCFAGSFGLFHNAADNSESDKVGMSAGFYTNAFSRGNYYGASSGGTIDSGGVAAGMYGHEVDVSIFGTGYTPIRSGFNAMNQGAKRAAGIDTAFSAMSGGPAGTYGGSWGGLMTLVNHGTLPAALHSSASMFSSDHSFPLQNIFDLMGAQVLDHYFKFQNFKVNGAGTITTAGNLIFDAGDYIEFDRINNGFCFKANGVPVLVSDATSTHPGIDAQRNLGWPGARWATIFASTAAINTSDATEKTSMRDFTDAELDAWGEVRMGAYQFLDAVAEKGSAARVHYGRIAQEVGAAFRRHGVDPSTLALWCVDRKTTTITKVRTVQKPKMVPVDRVEYHTEIVAGAPVQREVTITDFIQEVIEAPVVDQNGDPIMVSMGKILRDADGNAVMEKAPVILGYNEDGTVNFKRDDDGGIIYRDTSRVCYERDEAGEIVTYQVPKTHPVPVMEDIEEEYEETVELDEFSYGLRTEYCSVIEAAYQRRRADRIESRLSSLERPNAVTRAILAITGQFRHP